MIFETKTKIQELVGLFLPKKDWSPYNKIMILMLVKIIQNYLPRILLTGIFGVNKHYDYVFKDDGAILVFVPGWEQISKLSMLLDQKGEYALRSAQILPLHSLMPTVNQKAIFAKPPMGIRKVVIATNIAETSITIEDVVYVVDCGKIKISNFDVNNNISTLQPEWISVANLKQREGRAGRTQPGKCYHLLTRYKIFIVIF